MNDMCPRLQFFLARFEEKNFFTFYFMPYPYQ